MPQIVHPRLTKMAADKPYTPLKPCRSPYCECAEGKCTHPGFYDARGSSEPTTAAECLAASYEESKVNAQCDDALHLRLLTWAQNESTKRETECNPGPNQYLVDLLREAAAALTRSAALPTGAPSQRRLSGDRLTEVISWAETNATAFAKFPESEKSPADYLWMLCLAVLDLRDDVLEALRSNRSATERTIPADQMHVLDVYAGLESELRDLADRLRATYSGSAMRGLRSVGEWEMDTRKKSMCEAGLRLLASVVATRRSDSRGDSDA
jgi:hypothetical protein